MKSGKKALVGVGIIFVLSIIVALVIEGLFVEHIVDSEKQKHGIEFILPVEMSQDHGTAFTTPPWETMTVKIAKIEFYDEYAKIFISIENKDTRISELDPHYIHLYESKTYVKQGNSYYRHILPFGEHEMEIDGTGIPPQSIREGVIYLDTWNPNILFQLVLEGRYLEHSNTWQWTDAKFVFDIQP